MKISTDYAGRVALIMLLLATASAANAQSIYKCSTAGKVAYSDVPCVGQPGVVLHQPDDTQRIDQYLQLGLDDTARAYADAHNVLPLYKQRVDLRNGRTALLAQQQQANDATAQKQAIAADHREATVDPAANRTRLQGENDAFLEQNAARINALSHPLSSDTGASHNTGSNYRYGDAPSGRGQNHDYGTSGGRGSRGSGVNQTAPLVLHAPRYDHDHDQGSRTNPKPPTAVFNAQH